MRFNNLFIALVMSASLAAALTLEEAVKAEKRQCGGTDAECFLTNPGTCCSEECCCGVSAGPGNCSPTPCSIFQEEGIQPGLCAQAEV
ncbi:hypothetical protein DFH07DRAFT_968489 [Mycena maculata]|uniref:Uncharacterized protein n=1 Tax=Mycena maculata TaxID=230809 RepID=A0AAD7MTL5_9AGAR|nr:hypothetical protein DFH07DRAFT_968489 [Mycena maculata]